MKRQDFTSKLDKIRMKITKANTNRYKSRLDDLKMKICKAEEKHILSIINVYIPTISLIKKDDTILHDLYLDLSNLIREHNVIQL